MDASMGHGEEGDDMVVDTGPKQQNTGFELPFNVATLDDVAQRAYFEDGKEPEWLFSRAHAYLGVKTEGGRMLRNNKGAIQNELENLHVATSEFHYRGQDTQAEKDIVKNMKWKGHTFESRAFLVMLLWVMRNRTLQAQAKVKSLTLLLELAGKAFTMLDIQKPFMAILVKPDGQMVSRELRFSQQGLCATFAEFISHIPGAVALWKKLGTRCFLNRCIASGLETASFADLWMFLAYLYTHPKLKAMGCNLWNAIGKFVLPEMVCYTGILLSKLAVQASQEALRMLPLLKSKSGQARKAADPINKVLLLWKLRDEKLQRRRIAQTHDELGGGTSRMLVYEDYVDCLLHKRALEAGFAGCRQVSVTWDPSTYGGKEILMSVVYDPHSGKAGYLMSQQMVSTMYSELEPELVPLARERKLTRVEGFKEIKGLSSALGSINLSLADFCKPPSLFCRPLQLGEYRIPGNGGQFHIYDDSTDTMVPEIPEGMEIADLHILVSISDQGPNIVGAVNYLQYHPQHSILFLALFDPFHRAWNDIKLSLKRVSSGAWRHVLELTLVANLNYGPFGSSTWFWKKKSRLADFLATESAFSEIFQKFQHDICKERRIREPASSTEAQDLFDSLEDLESFNRKGPLIKLMRWFSWFETMGFYSGELVATKMLLEHSKGVMEAGSDKEIQEEGPVQSNKDPKKELADLKKRKGSFNLAPELITGKSLAVKDVIMSVCKATWATFAARAREILTPDHVLELNISCACQGYWKHELIETLNTSLNQQKSLLHLTPQYSTHEKVLEWHVELMDNLLEQRCMSLVAFHCLPPLKYCHILSPSSDVAIQAHRLANKEWQILLAAEGADLEGASVECLAHMAWRHNPLVRLIYMAFEQDMHRKLFFTDQSAAIKLVKVVGRTLGDSRLVENIHQHGRDLFRQSKANSFANVSIMSNCLRSKVLEGRKVPMINADAMEKVMGPQWDGKLKGSV